MKGSGFGDHPSARAHMCVCVCVCVWARWVVMCYGDVWCKVAWCCVDKVGIQMLLGKWGLLKE